MIGFTNNIKLFIFNPLKSLSTNGQSVLRSRKFVLRSNTFVISEGYVKSVWENSSKTF